MNPEMLYIMIRAFVFAAFCSIVALTKVLANEEKQIILFYFAILVLVVDIVFSIKQSTTRIIVSLLISALMGFSVITASGSQSVFSLSLFTIMIAIIGSPFIFGMLTQLKARGDSNG